MDLRTLARYRDRIETDLRANVLPFWMERVVDGERGTFHAGLSNDGTLNDAQPRGSLLTSRILWTYASAYRTYRDDDYRLMADFAYRDLEQRFWDNEHGGYVWSIHPDDRWARDRKQVYAQAFAIYALTEYHGATGRSEPLVRAQELFQMLERRTIDLEFGGYLEAFARDWSPINDMRLSETDQNDPKSQNTLLHVLEAYTNLVRVWPEAAAKAALGRLIDVMLHHVVDPKTHHLGLFFARDWTVKSDRISYGHDIEASWLLWEAVEALGDKAKKARMLPLVLAIADVTLAEGCDEDGSVFNAGGPEGVSDNTKEWWPQAEAMVGFLNAARLSGEDRYVAAALRSWDFIETRLIDRVHGEWFRGVDQAGAVLPDFEKVGFWKCPYHNGRAELEAIARLTAVGAF